MSVYKLPVETAHHIAPPTLEYSLSVGRAAVLETGPLPLQDHKSGTVCSQSQTTWAVIRPVQAVTGDIIIRTVRPRRSVNCFNCAKQKYSYLLTYLPAVVTAMYNLHFPFIRELPTLTAFLLQEQAYM